MPRVLHITTDYLPGTGGLERFVHDLAVRCPSIGFEPSVLCLNRIAGRGDRLPEDQVIDGVPVHRVGFVDLKYYKPTWLPIDRLRAADVLHVHGIGGPLDFVATTRRWHGRPIVASTHGGIFHTGNLAAVKASYFGLVKRWTLRRIDRLVACGEADRRLFADHGVVVTDTIDNGVELPPFGADRVPGRLLFVGRLAANKHVERLIAAVPPGATLRVVGPDRDGQLDRLKSLAAGKPVEFVGEVDDAALAEEYRRADLFVSASTHEGFGISAVEAMAAGAVPVVQDIPAFRVLLGDVGRRIDFAHFGAADRIAEILKIVAPLDRQRARDRAMMFSWERVMPEWKTLYTALLLAAVPKGRDSMTESTSLRDGRQNGY